MNKFFPLYKLIIVLVIVLIYRNLINKDRAGKLNYQFIITHLTAALFLMLGLRQFAFLTEFSVVKTLNEYGIQAVLKNANAHNLVNLFDWLLIATVLGFFISIIISSIIVRRKKSSMMNSLIAISIAFIMLLGLHFYDFDAILDVRNSMGNVCRGSWLAFKYIVPGILFISMGLFAFFNPWVNNLTIRREPQYIPEI